MDDSDQDFVDVDSKPLKRVRKKPAEARKRPRAEQKSASQGSSGREKRTENHKRDVGSGSRRARTQPDRSAAGAEPEVVCRGTGHDSGGAGRPEKGMRAKDKVLQRMQQFKRASPQKMASTDKSQATQQDGDCAPPPAAVQRPDTPEDVRPGLQPEPQDGDEALALRLQQELDREAAQAQTVDLEDGGLFFCHICHRDLTHMTPNGRSQHVNRCLDESEERAPSPPPPPPPPPPGVPDCPICGKKFKLQKSRSAHLKRCSSDMGVPPAVLLQALQRQAEETRSVPTTSRPTETGATKRKGSSKTDVQARKKPRQKAEPLDEETMVALALSSSLVEQQKESARASQAETVVSSLVSAVPEMKWRPDAGKGRGKKKKGAVPRPPPLLLIQDAGAAVARLQERVSALLLRNPPPSPPTPTRRPSSLSGRSGAAPLWQKSSLLEAATMRLSDFYVPELSDFITPCESTTTDAAPSSTFKPESSVPPVGEGAAVSETRTSSLPSTSSSSSQPAAASSSPSAPPTPQTQQPLVSSQALRDLMELAEEGMSVTQRGYAALCADRDSAGLTSNLQLSGFLPEEPGEQVDLQTSGFLPEAHARSDCDRHPIRAAHPGAERRRHTAAALSRLGSDLSSMVNNPQLSDVQLQVDSGDVYFAHSFMVYARCPLLAEMVHEGGFGVQEDGMAAAQRVLLTDVPGQAVLALLRYLYTAQCSVPASLRPHVLELASRFDLEELQQLCELRLEGDDEDSVNREESATEQTDQAFMELLRSMWNEGGEDGEATDAEGGPGEAEGRAEEEDGPADDLAAGGGEACEDKVNEEELEEIYEFAATQRKKGEEEEEEKEEADTVEEEEEEGDEGGHEVFAQLAEPSRSSQRCSVGEQQGARQPETSLDRSYSRLFSGSWGTHEDGDSASTPPTSQPKTDAPLSPTSPSPRKSLSKLSDRALLQSSGSVVAGLSPSPPSCVSNLPVPGLSPGQGRDQETDAAQESPPVKRESRGPRSICRPVSPDPPDPPQNKTEPELIVLSDSSSEAEMVLSSRSPSPPPSPRAVQDCRSYTHIKPQPVLTAHEPASEASSRSESSPGLSSHTRDPGPPGCSPEVSWLIPSTPLQHGRSTASSSTQTRSSMCRTRLFPNSEASSSSSLSSSPALPRNSGLRASKSPVPVHISPVKDSFQLLEASPLRSSPDPDFLSGSGRKSSRLARDVFAVPGSQSKRSPSTFSKQDTPLRPQPQPYSSTPLHALHQQPPHPPPAVASPLHGVSQKASSVGTATPPESLEKTELGSFHLSPLTDPSEPTCSSSHGAPQSSPQSRQSGGFGSHGNTGSQVARGKEDGGRDAGDEEQRDEAPGESAEAESSFHHSFMVMDEPPIAFNDSWGLGACVDANPGRFSLRLEDSGGSSQRGGAATSSSSSCQTSPPSRPSSAVRGRLRRSPATAAAAAAPPKTPPEISNSLLDSKIWDSWQEEEEEALPLSHRVKPSAQLRTPAALSCNKRRRTLVPITPMPHYSDMDTPELKNKLNRFGVRPLPKRQMILKLKEIHQYTHQLASSDSEDDGPSARTKPPHGGPAAAVANGPRSRAQTVTFKEPTAPPVTSPLKFNRDEEEAEPLSASQGSDASSAAEESERSNPELAPPSSTSDGDSDADSGISASQAATRLQDRLQAVRSFILSDPELYTQILQYQPLVLSAFQARLKAAGIRLGAAKLVDFLDSQCITFTTAKPGHQVPGHQAPGRGRGRKPGPRLKAAGDAGKSRKKGPTAVL